jgi:hypothetical protein
MVMTLLVAGVVVIEDSEVVEAVVVEVEEEATPKIDHFSNYKHVFVKLPCITLVNIIRKNI